MIRKDKVLDFFVESTKSILSIEEQKTLSQAAAYTKTTPKTLQYIPEVNIEEEDSVRGVVCAVPVYDVSVKYHEVNNNMVLSLMDKDGQELVRTPELDSVVLPKDGLYVHPGLERFIESNSLGHSIGIETMIDDVPYTMYAMHLNELQELCISEPSKEIDGLSELTVHCSKELGTTTDLLITGMEQGAIKAYQIPEVAWNRRICEEMVKQIPQLYVSIPEMYRDRQMAELVLERKHEIPEQEQSIVLETIPQQEIEAYIQKKSEIIALIKEPATDLSILFALKEHADPEISHAATLTISAREKEIGDRGHDIEK